MTTNVINNEFSTTRRVLIAIACLVVFCLVVPSSRGAGYSQRADERESVVSLAVESENETNVQKNDSVQEPWFRFWKAPEESMARWPWGDKTYYPLPIKSFNEWLQINAEHKRGTSGQSDVQTRIGVPSLRLDARFDGDCLEGRGVFTTTNASSNAASTLPAQPFRTRDFSLAFSFSSNDEVKPDERLGFYSDALFYWPTTDRNDRAFRWSRRGEVNARGDVSFDLAFPSSIHTELTLDVPQEFKVETSEGLIREVEVPKSEETREVKRWKIFFGARSCARIYVSRTTPPLVSTESQRVSYRRETTFNVSQEGLEINAQFEFDALSSFEIEPELFFPKPLTPASFEWNGQDASPFIVERADTTSGTSLTFRFPTSGENSARGSLRVVAFCPLARDFDGTLPDALLESDEFFWRETLCRVHIVSPLVASSIFPKDAVQTRDSSRARSSEQESFLFKYVKAEGEIALRLRERKPAPKFDSVTDCLVLPSEAIVKTTLLVNFDETTTRQIEIPIASNWTIESVLTSAEEPIIWNVHEQDDSRSRVLFASFKNAPTPKQPTRLTISGRLSCSFEKGVELDRLCPVDISENLYGAHAVSLRSESQSQVKITSRSGRSFVVRNTNPDFIFSESQLREVLSSTPGAVRFYFGEQTVDAVATLENLRSNYSVDVSCRARLFVDRFEEKWNLRFTPSSGARVDSVVFFASESTQKAEQTSDWFWSTSSEPNKIFEAERLDAPEALARAPKGSVPYEIKLSTSRTVPFELNVCHTSKTADVVQVPLLFFDEETEKTTSEIIVDSPESVPFWTRGDSLTPTSAPAVPQGQYESLKRAFRYKASMNSRRLSNVPKLEISFSSFNDKTEVADVLTSSLWCWFENYDSFYEANGSSRERVAYFLENRGSSYFNVTLPSELGFEAIRSVWVDGVQISVAKPQDDDKTNVLQIELPSVRRFVCVTIECYVKNLRNFGNFRRIPYRFQCEAPVLSGAWNAWTPSQYQPLTNGASSANFYWARLQDRMFSRYFRTKKSTEVASRMASRLGSFATLREIVATSRSAESLGTKDALTWGDVFGSERVVEALCTPEAIRDALEVAQDGGDSNESLDDAKADDVARKDAEKEKTTDEQDDGKKLDSTQKVKKPFRFCIDLVALARIGLTPRTPIPLVDARDVMEGAEKLLDSVGLIVLFLDADFAVLTTYETALRYDLSSVPLNDCANVRLIKNEYDSVDAQTHILNSFGRRFVEPSAWLKADELISPWHEIQFDENTPGWEHVSLPLDRADEGAYFIHRNFLAALGFFSFVVYVALTWNFKTFSFRFFLGTIGVGLALLCLLPLILSVVVEGVVTGACCLFILSCFQRENVASDESNAKNPVQNGRLADNRTENSEGETTCGFVDLKRLSPEEYAFVQGSQTSDAQSDMSPDSAVLRSGRSSVRILGALVLVCVLIMAGGAASRRTDDGNESTTAPTTQKSESSTPLGVDLHMDVEKYPRAEADDEENTSAPGSWSDPYRVFVPINKERLVSGDYYWVESSFYDVIRSALKSRSREKNWRVVDARYEGGVEYNGDGVFLLYNLKITYKICLDVSNVVVSIPSVQLAPDVGARFDKQTISPIYDAQHDELSFEIVDSNPGEHTLELTVVLPAFSENEDEISIPVVPSPSARAEFSVPNDAPALDIPNALGKTTRNSSRLIAELGPVDRLILKKGDVSSLDAASTFNVEQYALMKLKPTQTELRSLFRGQVSSGKIQRLEIECDPSFAFSGYCKCDVAEITSIEPPSVQDPTLRVSFDKPVSGAFTLTADFAARDFAGVGQIPIPRFLCRGAHVARNWLALASYSDLLCSHLPDSNVSVSSFKTAWGALDETPLAVCDLVKTPKDAFVATRVPSGSINLSETKTYVFRPSYVEIRLRASFEAEAETFRLTLSAPKSLVVDSIKLFDEQGKALEKPESVSTDEELTLIFDSPLKGSYSLEITGRSKTRVDKKEILPRVAFRNCLLLKSFVRIYCDENVFLEFVPSTSWNPLDQASFAELGEEPGGSLYRAGVYEINLSAPNPDEVASEDEPPAETAQSEPDESSVSDEQATESARFVVKVNAPQISGVGRIVMYHKYTEDWKATVEFKLSIQNGRVERFFVLTDDSFSIDSPDQNADFNLSETTTPAGTRAIMFEPKRRLKEEVVLKFDATFKKGREGLRLPRYVLLPGSEREDVANIKTYVLLPKRDDSLELSWSTRNMRELAQGSDEWKSATSFSPPSVNPSTAALAKNGAVSTTSNTENSTNSVTQDAETKDSARNSGLMRRVNDDVGMKIDEFYIYERNEGASASFETEQVRLRVSLARYMFFVNGRHDYFGAVNFLIPPNGLDECVVVAPKDCKILEANVNGSRRLVERLDERRWKVDLDSTKYSKFLEISFQGVGNVTEDDRATFGTKDSDVFDVRFVQIEGVVPEQTLWVCAFENAEATGERWQVFQRDADKSNDLKPTKEERIQCVKEPAAYQNASELLFKLTISHATELFEAFERDAALSSEKRDDDFERLRSRWATSWFRLDEELKRFPYLERPQNDLTESQRNAILCIQRGKIIDALSSETSPWTTWNYARLLEILAQKDKLAENGRFNLNSVDVDEFDSSLPRRLWTLDVGSDARLLAGTTDEKPERVVFVAPRRSVGLFFSSYATCVFILATTAVLLNLFKRESTSRKFRSVFFGVLICVWTLMFFLFNAKLAGLLGAALLAVGPPTLSSIQRRLAVRREARLNSRRQNRSDGDDSDLAGLDATTELNEEDVSTKTSGVNPDSEGTTVPCEDLNWNAGNDSNDSNSSYNETFFD